MGAIARYPGRHESRYDALGCAVLTKLVGIAPHSEGRFPRMSPNLQSGWDLDRYRDALHDVRDRADRDGLNMLGYLLTVAFLEIDTAEQTAAQSVTSDSDVSER